MVSPRLFPAAQLRRLARAPGRTPVPGDAAAPAEKCELCSEPIPGEHRHLLELSARQLCCACRACALLFDRKAVGTGRYRAVPALRRRLDGLVLDDVIWAGLGVPVRLAFFVRHESDPDSGVGPDDPVNAYYPSPLGVVAAPVEPEVWQRVLTAHPDLDRLAPEVTALLIHRALGEHWLVGIDECFSLTARVRRSWTGMTGGDEVWDEIDRFFAELRAGAGLPSHSVNRT